MIVQFLTWIIWTVVSALSGVKLAKNDVLKFVDGVVAKHHRISQQDHHTLAMWNKFIAFVTDQSRGGGASAVLSALRAVHNLMERDTSHAKSALGGRPCNNGVWVPAKELQDMKEELETLKQCLAVVHQTRANEKAKLEELYGSLTSLKS